MIVSAKHIIDLWTKTMYRRYTRANQSLNFLCVPILILEVALCSGNTDLTLWPDSLSENHCARLNSHMSCETIHFMISGSINYFWKVSRVGTSYTITIRCSFGTSQLPSARAVTVTFPVRVNLLTGALPAGEHTIDVQLLRGVGNPALMERSLPMTELTSS